MKTNKSTEECNKYNLENAIAISVGVLESIEPDDIILRKEEIARNQVIKGESTKSAALAIFKSLDPKFEEKVAGGNNRFRAHCHGIVCEIEGVRDRYESEPKSWRLTLGADNYGHNPNKKWIKVGTDKVLGMDAKQFDKAKNALNELVGATARERDLEQRSKENRLRNEILFNQFPAFFKRANIGYAGDKYSVTVDGKIYMSNFNYTLTMEQWEQVFDLRDAQKVEMAALYKSFEQKV